MRLTIISPQATQEYNVLWVELNTPTGNFVIQPAHAPMLLLLEPKKPIIFELNNGIQESITISQGIAEVTRTSVTILMSS